jgi:hypothetical protein
VANYQGSHVFMVVNLLVASQAGIVLVYSDVAPELFLRRLVKHNVRLTECLYVPHRIKNLIAVYIVLVLRKSKMPERNVINCLAGQASPLLFGRVDQTAAIMSHSLFHPRKWTTSTPFVIDHIKVPSNSSFGFGQDVNFEYTKSASLLLDVALEITLPAATITNTVNPANPPGQAYYVDHLGYAFIDNLTLYYGQNKVFDHDKYDLYFKYRERFPNEIRDHVNDVVFGDKTTAERTALLVNGTPAGQPLIVPLYYIDRPDAAVPLISLSQRLRWTLKSELLNNLIVRPTDGTATVTLPQGGVQVQLCLTVAHVTGAEADHMLSLTNGEAGLTYMIHQCQRQYTNTIATTQGNRTIAVQLNNFNRALKIVRWALLPFHLQDNTGRNDYFMFQPQPPLPLPPGPGVNPGMTPYNPIISWNITATGLIVQRQILNLYSKTYLRHFWSPASPGEEIFFQAYSIVPLLVNSSCGMLDYNNLPNPVLNIELGPGGTGTDPDNALLPQTLLIILSADDYNFWYFNRGNFTRAFN